jgi:hypothetical protein
VFIPILCALFLLNKPFVYLCIQSIIRHSSEKYNVCVIDDTSFSELIDYNVNLDEIAEPIRKNVRTEALLRVLHTYGGVIVPSSVLMLKPIEWMTGDFVVFDRTRSVVSEKMVYMPSIEFMGADKGSPFVEKCLKYMKSLNLRDMTNEKVFCNEMGKWLYQCVVRGEIKGINEHNVGLKTITEDDVIVDNLLKMDGIKYSDDVSCIWLPENEMMSRLSYQWFVRMSPDQIMNSNVSISHYFRLALQ